MFKSVYQVTAVHVHSGPGSCHHGTHQNDITGPVAAWLISYVSMKPVAPSGFISRTWDMILG